MKEENIVQETQTTPEQKSQKSKKGTVIAIVSILVVACLIGVSFLLLKNPEKKSDDKKGNGKVYTKYNLQGNSLEDFDLSFLQLENGKTNKIYSPLSIKYALAMLEEGANGETRDQITNTIGKYQFKKYPNSNNITVANALFIKDSNKSSIKESYKTNLANKFDAEVIYDSFANPSVLNNWVKEKTFKLIDNLVDDISGEDFVLVNTLAIDMEWVNKIQSEEKFYNVNYAHRDYSYGIGPLQVSDYYNLKFKDLSYDVKAVEFGAVINKYDIVNTLGEENIRKTVGDKYQQWLNEGAPNSCNESVASEPDKNTYLNQYIKELNKGYNDISSSTDFSFYTDDNVKVFAKDLKKYDGVTLQYVAVMPKKESLDNYIANIKAENINTLIKNLKPIELSSFKEGVITEVTGYIPMFKFDYELSLMNDLKQLGITNIFDSNKADLSNLTSNKSIIDKVAHKTNIEFSNNGIKAASATSLGGAGAATCGFDYLYEVPVEKIDLTFDNPYLFIIRDKDTNEVWFVGTVYEPIKFEASEQS